MALKAIVPANHALRVTSLVVYIYADPGIGKTSLAFTASKPLLLDFDAGAHRTGKLRRGATVSVTDWLDVANIEASDVDGFDSIVLDTAGRALDVIKSHLAENKNNRQNDGALKLKAQGYANELFKNWINRIRGYGKDVIIIAHATEDRKGDDIIFRPDVGGKNRNELYRQADLMGYLTNIDSKEGKAVRMLSFTPSTAYHAKNSGGLGNVELPDLVSAPSFLGDLIIKSKEHINSLTDEQVLELKHLDDLTNFKNDCESCENAGDLNDLLSRLTEDDGHPYLKQMRLAFSAAVKGLAVNYDKEQGRYFDRPASSNVAPMTDPGPKSQEQTQSKPEPVRIDVMRHLKAITNAINNDALLMAIADIPDGVSPTDKATIDRAIQKRQSELSTMAGSIVDSILKDFQNANDQALLDMIWKERVDGFPGVISEQNRAALQDAYNAAFEAFEEPQS